MPRISGKQGSLYLADWNTTASGVAGVGIASAGNYIGDLYNWELEIIQELLECSIKLETHEQYAPDRVTSKVTGERYVQNSLLSSPFSAALLHAIANSTPVEPVNARMPFVFGGLTVAFSLWGIDAPAASGAPHTGIIPVNGPVITGEGFFNRVTLKGPRGAASEAFEITCISVPVVVN